MVLLLGPTGAGKSYQAELLATKHPQFVWVPLGALLRNQADPQLKSELLTGDLIDDEQVEDVLKRKLSNLKSEQLPLIDGFPRRMSQVPILDSIAAQLKRKIQLVVSLSISRAEAEKRLARRHRADDTKTAIAEKWQIFEQETSKVIDHYNSLGLVVNINGEQPPKLVTKQIESALPGA